MASTLFKRGSGLSPEIQEGLWGPSLLGELDGERIDAKVCSSQVLLDKVSNVCRIGRLISYDGLNPDFEEQGQGLFQVRSCAENQWCLGDFVTGSDKAYCAWARSALRMGSTPFHFCSGAAVECQAICKQPSEVQAVHIDAWRGHSLDTAMQLDWAVTALRFYMVREIDRCLLLVTAPAHDESDRPAIRVSKEDLEGGEDLLDAGGGAGSGYISTDTEAEIVKWEE